MLKKKLFKIPIGIKFKEDKPFGRTDEFVNVLSTSRRGAEQQIRRKYLRKGQVILR